MMKFLIAVVTVGVLASIVMAGSRWTKRSILDFNNGSTNLENSTAIPNETRCRPLSDAQTKEKIITLGVLENPGVTLVNVSGHLLSALQANGTVTFVIGKRKKRDIANQLCPEEAVLIYTLANEGGYLAYRIVGTRCAKGNGGVSLQHHCSIQAGGSVLQIGSCIGTVAKIVLHVMSKCGDPFYKTITIDCSCKCNKYSDF